jgi:hypothetical protein
MAGRDQVSEFAAQRDNWNSRVTLTMLPEGKASIVTLRYGQ